MTVSGSAAFDPPRFALRRGRLAPLDADRFHFVKLISRGSPLIGVPLGGGNSSVVDYPDVEDPEKVGTYPASAFAGGGYVWDTVLEYRVWCYPRLGAPDEYDGSDYYYAFASCQEAEEFSQGTVGARPPLALVLQREYIDEPAPGVYVHERKERVTEWPVAFLSRPRRTAETIPSFMAPDAPTNRLEILRGTVEE